MAKTDYTRAERRSLRRRGILRLVPDALFGTLRWIERHVRGFYSAVGLFLVIGLSLALGAVLAFVGLAELMDEGVVQPFDEAILLLLHRHASSPLDTAALEITALGSTVVLSVAVLAVSAFLWISRHHYSVALLWIAVIGGQLLNSVLKAGFDRPRPQLFEWRVPHAGFSSFPSGHAMTSMVVYGTIAYLIVRLEPTKALRRLTFGFTALLVLLVGMSRLYLGVHYPSDVIAGYVAGLAWATFAALGMEAIRYFRARKPGVEEAEHDIDKGTRPIREALEPGD